MEVLINKIYNFLIGMSNGSMKNGSMKKFVLTSPTYT